MESLKSELLASPRWYEVGQAGPGKIDDPAYSHGLIRMHPLYGYLSELVINQDRILLESGDRDSEFAIQGWTESDGGLLVAAVSDKLGKYDFRFSRLQVDCSKSGLGSNKQWRIFDIVKMETAHVSPDSGTTETGVLYLVSQHDLPDVPEGHEY